MEDFAKSSTIFQYSMIIDTTVGSEGDSFYIRSVMNTNCFAVCVRSHSAWISIFTFLSFSVSMTPSTPPPLPSCGMVQIIPSSLPTLSIGRMLWPATVSIWMTAYWFPWCLRMHRARPTNELLSTQSSVQSCTQTTPSVGSSSMTRPTQTTSMNRCWRV